MCVIQAYTSQFVALIMFALMLSEDRLSLKPRRLEIINSLRVLPGRSDKDQKITITVHLDRPDSHPLTNKADKFTFSLLLTFFSLSLIVLLSQSSSRRC